MSDNRIRWAVSLRKKDIQLIEHFKNVELGDRSAESRRLTCLGLTLINMLNEGKVLDISSLDPSKLHIIVKPKS